MTLHHPSLFYNHHSLTDLPGREQFASKGNSIILEEKIRKWSVCSCFWKTHDLGHYWETTRPILEAKEIKKLCPRGHLKAVKLRSYLLAAESRAELGTDNRREMLYKLEHALQMPAITILSEHCLQ